MLAAPAGAPAADVTIGHRAPACLPRNGFALLSVAISSASAVRSAKLYFRAEPYPDFYYVPMKPGAAGFVAVLPKPSPETERVIYYVEAVQFSFDSTRTAEYDAPVDDDCRRRDPLAAYFMGDNPAITVGATRTGAAAIPPGFQASGIAGFISASGISAGAGGGLGAGTGIVIGAAGAAAGVAVAAATAGEQTPGSVAGVVITPAPGGATTSIGGAGAGPTTTTVSGSPSSTTTVPPGTPTTTTSTGGGTTTSSSTSSTTTTSVQPPVACFTARSLGGCRLELDASCSTGTITQYRWDYQQLPGPNASETRSSPGPFVHDWSGDVSCTLIGCSFLRSVTLTVVGPGGSSQTAQNILILCLAERGETNELASSFTSVLTVPSLGGAARGRVFLNGILLEPTASSLPVLHRVAGRAGENLLEAYLDTPIESGLWKFDFSGAAHFVPGSLEVVSGAVVSLDAHAVLFALTGADSQRVKLRFQLGPRR